MKTGARIIAIASMLKAAPPIADLAAPLTDTRNHRVRDLRISVTDRCNFRCVYCMPKAVLDGIATAAAVGARYHYKFQ